MKKNQGTIIVDTNRCKGCALCIPTCPKQCITITTREVNTKGYPYATLTQSDNCTGCASCAIICPDACITVYRKTITQ